MPTGIGGEFGWWCPSLDDAGNGTTTVNDFGSGGNNGTLVNMDAASDWVADTDSGGVRALDFDGSNDYVVTGPVGAAEGSVSMWGKFRKLATTDQTQVLCGALAPGLASGMSMGAPNINDYRFQIYDGTGWRRTGSAFVPTLNQWYHLVGIWGSAGVKLFVDAIQHGSTNAYTSGWSTGYTGGGLQAGMKIGNYEFSHYSFDGLIDDVRIFHRILTTDEITALASMRGYQPPSTARRRPSIRTGGNFSTHLKTGGDL